MQTIALHPVLILSMSICGTCTERIWKSEDIKVTLSDFNINNLLTTLKQYYRGGRYDFLLNSDKNIDLLSKRFIVFEIDQVKDN